MKPIASAFAALTISLAASPAARAQENPPGVNPTHFQCYRVESEKFDARDVKLRDQFGTSGAKVLKPALLCTPVEKNGVPVRDKRTNLICYEEEGGSPADRKVNVTNQFGKSALTVGRPELLCVPSLKQVIKQ